MYYYFYSLRADEQNQTHLRDPRRRAFIVIFGALRHCMAVADFLWIVGRFFGCHWFGLVQYSRSLESDKFDMFAIGA